MKADTEVTGLSIGVIGLIVAVFGGWLSYHTLDGVVGMVFLSILLLLCAFIGVIPFAGFVGYIALSKLVIIPDIMALAGVEPTWVSSFLFIWYLIWAVILTIATTVALGGN